MVVFDTSIIIDHLRSTSREDTLFMSFARQLKKEELALSVISIQELYEGKSSKNEKKENYLLATISPLKILSYTYEIAKLAGKIARDLTRPIEIADCAIAATCIVNRASLSTLNTKDFIGIRGLKIAKL